MLINRLREFSTIWENVYMSRFFASMGARILITDCFGFVWWCRGGSGRKPKGGTQWILYKSFFDIWGGHFN